MAHSPADARALESPGTAASREWMARLFDAAESSAKPPSNAKPPARREAKESSWFNPEAFTEAKRSWLRGLAREATTPSGRRERNGETLAECLSSDETFAFSSPDSRAASSRSGYVDDFGEATPIEDVSFSPQCARDANDANDANDDDDDDDRPDAPFERFFVVGVPPDAKVTATAESSSAARAANADLRSRVEARPPQNKKPHRGTSGVTHPARVLFAYPPRGVADAGADAEARRKPKRNPRADLENVESFCFPDGVATKLVERTPSMSAVLNVTCGSSRTPGNPGGGVEANDRSFVFSVGGGDERPERLFGPDGAGAAVPGDEPGVRDSRDSRTPRVLYGVCVYAEELVRREPGVCRADRLARRRARRHLQKMEGRRARAKEDGNAADREDDSGNAPTSRGAPRERYLVSADRCYCFLSHRPAFEWHFEVLRAVAAAERLARAREAAEEMRALGDDAPTEGDDAPGDDVGDASREDAVDDDSEKTWKNAMCDLSESFAVVAAYDVFDVSPALRRLGGSAGVSSETVARFRTLRRFATDPALATTPPMTFPGERFPADAFSVFEHSADRWRVATACRVLSLETLLTAATAALLERRVVVAHPNLGELSAIVFALTRAFFKPSRYRSLVLPIVPDAMLDLLEAPVPFVLGVRYKTAETRAACAAPGVVRVNAYKDAAKVSGGGAAARQTSDHSLPALPGKKALLEALRPSYDACRSAALEAARAGAPFPYPLSVSSSAGQETERARARSDDDEEEACVTVKSHANASAREAAREARRAAGVFLETWREYLRALVSKEALAPHAITDVTVVGDRVTVLMKDSFVESFRVADRAFAEALVDTQAFQAHADALLRF